MRDFSRKQLNAHVPAINPLKGIDFCLGQLYADTAHFTSDCVVRGLTFEELIGALISARNELLSHAEEADDF